MAENFVAQAVTSSGVVFATHIRASDSAHFPLGKIVWGGDSATFNQTSTSTPFPVSIYGTSSSAPLFVGNNSATPVFVRDENSTTVTVTGYTAPSTTVTITGWVAPSTTVTITGYVAPSTTVTVTGYSTAVSVTGYVAPSTTVTVTGYVAPSTTVTVTGYTAPSTTISLSGSTVQTAALQAFTAQISSVVTTVSTSAGRLYGYSVFNPDTAGNVFLKIYPEDSGGVTLGTSSATMDIGIPFGGGANISFPQGIGMSSGIGLAAAGGAGSTNHAAPSTTITVTVWYVA